MGDSKALFTQIIDSIDAAKRDSILFFQAREDIALEKAEEVAKKCAKTLNKRYVVLPSYIKMRAFRPNDAINLLQNIINQIKTENETDMKGRDEQ